MDAEPPRAPPPLTPPPVAWRLDSPTVSVLRSTCVDMLEQAMQASARLDDAGDGEALHDVRVAIRRLRSQLRAYKTVLPRAAAGKVRDALRELAAATGEARDLEVQLGWLSAQRDALDEQHRAALDALMARLVRRQRPAMARARKETLAGLPRLRSRIERRLEEDEALAVSTLPAFTTPSAGEARFRGAAAARIVAAAIELRDAARLVRSALDEVPAHRARIAAKRLRYLLEPLREVDPPPAAEATRALVKRLKEVQDLLGDLHDAHVISHVIERALVGAAASEARQAHRLVTRPRAARARARPGGGAGPDPRRGLLAIDRLGCRRRDQLFADLRAKKRVRAFDVLLADSRRLADLLKRS